MCELLYFCMYTHTVINRVFKLCAVTLGIFGRFLNYYVRKMNFGKVVF
jgi:hypothetical protein